MPKRRRIAALLRGLEGRQPPPYAAGSVHRLRVRRSSSSSGSPRSAQQRRRFTVLRRSDLLGHSHDEIARDVGLSRSQFYRDLQEARERFAIELERAFSVRAATPDFLKPGAAARQVAIETLRDSGKHDQARVAATASLRDAEADEAVELLCLRAELEIECGDLAAAPRVARARALLPQVVDKRLRRRLAIACDLADFEAAHCYGSPSRPARREACLADVRLRHAAGESGYAGLLVKALIGEASLLFGRGEEPRALVEEAAALVRREPSIDARLAVDVQVRVSGLHALRADALSTALDEAALIVETGMRWRNARTLRLGLQSTSAHLLTLGRLEQAKDYALQARALIELFGSPLDHAIVLCNLARIEVHRKDGAQALRWIGLARDARCNAFPITQAIAISEAEALALVDQPARALQAARAAGALVQGWPRLHARAKLAEAIALSALEPSREARRCSSEAVELSRVAGGPLVELRALDLNVKLTGDAGARRALCQLQAVIATSTV